MRFALIALVIAPLLSGVSAAVCEPLWTAYTTVNSGIVDNYVTAVAAGPEGIMWFATGKGVSSFDGVVWKSYKNGVVFDHNAIFTDMAVDTRGIVWLADTRRIVRLDPESDETREIPSELRSRTAIKASIAFDLDGALWYGAYGGIAVSDGHYLTPAFGVARAEDRFIMDIACDRKGVLWFARADGVLRFDGVTPYDVQPLRNLYISAAAPESDTNMWFGLHDGGAVRYDGIDRENFLDVDELAGTVTRAIAVDGNGTVWFATESGVVSLDDGSWRLHTSDDGLPHDFAMDAVIDGMNRVWIATVGGAACLER